MITSHMPENHRQYLTYTKDDFQSWASTIGLNTEKIVRFFLESGKAPEQGFKSCVSLKKTQIGTKLSESKKRASKSFCSVEILHPWHPGIAEIPGKERWKNRSIILQRTNHRRSHGFIRGSERCREGGDET